MLALFLPHKNWRKVLFWCLMPSRSQAGGLWRDESWEAMSAPPLLSRQPARGSRRDAIFLPGGGHIGAFKFMKIRLFVMICLMGRRISLISRPEWRDDTRGWSMLSCRPPSLYWHSCDVSCWFLFSRLEYVVVFCIIPRYCTVTGCCSSLSIEIRIFPVHLVNFKLVVRV